MRNTPGADRVVALNVLLPLLGAMRNGGDFSHESADVIQLLPLLGAMRNRRSPEQARPHPQLLPLLGAMRNQEDPDAEYPDYGCCPS